MATALASAASCGPSHRTGNASTSSQAWTRFPPWSTRVTATVVGSTFLPAPSNRPPEALSSHLKSLSVSVTPRRITRLGQLSRPGSLWTKLFWPPSSSTSTVISARRPLTSLNNPICWPSTSKMKLPAIRMPPAASGKFPHLLPGALVQAGDTGQQPGPIPVFEVEQGVELPVQVIGEVGDLIPHRLGADRSQPDPSLRTSIRPPTPAAAIAGSGAGPSPLSFPFPFSGGNDAGKGWRYASSSSWSSDGSPKLMIP